MAVEFIPGWMNHLDEEDIIFIRNFVLASGSLKEIAEQYSVSYPTVRLRLDRMIQKIQVGESVGQDPYIAKIKELTLSERIDFDTAKLLIAEYKKTKKETTT